MPAAMVEVFEAVVVRLPRQCVVAMVVDLGAATKSQLSGIIGRPVMLVAR